MTTVTDETLRILAHKHMRLAIIPPRGATPITHWMSSSKMIIQ